MTFDSRPDTKAHIEVVRRYLNQFGRDLALRGARHDRSKLRDPELAVFNEFSPQLANLKYGSPGYAASLEAMGEGLRHHYAMNDHHPEHHPNGVQDMHLGQIIEMLADWKASTERVDGGDLAASIRQNAGRFGYGPELEGLLLRTARAYGWVSGAT